ncbi:MAG: B12-binding domain-containing radical SAM protein [Pseudomonadales bacterium]|nr:B12-binding domain-containing radical SAM protein [Pseudomonadales bacterium]
MSSADSLDDLGNDMKRPVWLFSMDSERFSAAPMTTGGLKACFQQYGQTAPETDVELVHFLVREEIDPWFEQQWLQVSLPQAQQALAAGVQPVVGFSVYTWNAAEFIDLLRRIRQSCPEIWIILGGPHVQQVEDYLLVDPIDAVVMGEGEFTLVEWLDRAHLGSWRSIQGLAFVEDGQIVKNPARARTLDLSIFPSALDVIPLTDDAGKPLYESVAYETSRGCPFKCSFCEWGTGALGTKIYQFPLERVRSDWEKIVGAGIANIWLADSNFGALKDDIEKARLICELKDRTGLPSTFATSWSKKHNPRVQEIVQLLNEHGLLPHYQLALQTLTPLALELSNRKNMAANEYEPSAKAMAEAGVPIAAELIWGLPGDNLKDFETNLDRLIATFPNVNIFTYNLLPGTEFYEKRFEYQIETVPVAGYGRAKGEYVIGCHTFSVEEGLEGYFLIAAHMILVHGTLLPFTIRYLALEASIPASPLLRTILKALLQHYGHIITDSPVNEMTIHDKLRVYENRAELYVALFDDLPRAFSVIREAVHGWLQEYDAVQALYHRVDLMLALDMALCPRKGNPSTEIHTFDGNASAVIRALEAMDLPAVEDLAGHSTLAVDYPGGVGTVLKDPDGGSWMRGDWRVVQSVGDGVQLVGAVSV